jgi:Tol biopolymer transport system component
VTDNKSVDSAPSWSPKGDLLAFQSNRRYGSRVWATSVDGRRVTRLTSGGAGDDFVPDWGA